MAQVISVLVKGGEATAGAALGGALGPLGIPVGKVIGKINEETKEYKGLQVPVKIIVNPATKDFELEVGMPPVSALVKKEIYNGKLVLTKSYRSAVNASHRRRGWMFKKTGGRYAKKLENADGKTFLFGETTLSLQGAIGASITGLPAVPSRIRLTGISRNRRRDSPMCSPSPTARTP